MEIKRSILVSLGILSWLGIMAWCTKEDIKSDNNKEITINNNDNQSQILDNQSKQQKEISIWPGCIWCGKCTQIAPNNFAMSGREAIVISQENLDWNEVQMAIKRCPVSVIDVS